MSGVGSLIVIARYLLYVFYFFLSLILEKIVLVDYASNLLFLFASLRGKITPAGWLFATLPCSPVQRLHALFRHRETKGFKTRGRGRRKKKARPIHVDETALILLRIELVDRRIYYCYPGE